MMADNRGCEETLFMTMNNIGGRYKRFPRVGAWNERTELQCQYVMSSVLVSRATKPNQTVLLWIAVVGDTMTRNDVKQVLAALGWIFRSFSDEKLEKYQREHAD